MAKFLVVGNYSHDENILKNGQQVKSLGGSPSYIHRVFSSLGADYDLVAKVGPDFLYSDQVGKKPIVGQGPTTHFVNDYRGKLRRQWASHVSDPIFPKELKGKYDVVIACAIAGEIPLDSFVKLTELSSCVIVDVQGLIRDFDKKGRVFNLRLEETPYWNHLDRIHFLKANPHEALSMDLSQVTQKTTLIVTEGELGCRLIDSRGEIRIPTLKVEERDPTGAGDSFIAGFAFGLSQAWNPAQACQLGNYCGAIAASQEGLPTFDKSELQQQLKEIQGL